jgi:hypothetical protein
MAREIQPILNDRQALIRALIDIECIAADSSMISTDRVSAIRELAHQAIADTVHRAATIRRRKQKVA